MDFYNKSLSDNYKELNSSDKGLTSEEVKTRLTKYGSNELKQKKKISPIMLFLGQFTNPLVIVLIAAALISLGVGYYEYKVHGTDMAEAFVEAGVIGLILVANALLGFIQEYNAEKAIESLKKMASLKAVVLRDGKKCEVEAKDLVQGDILFLSEGERIPADSRLLTVVALQTLESALTGESLPVKKEITDYNGEKALGDQKNMVFSGTVITAGRGTALVVKTGMDTEIGKIATMIEDAETEETPLQKRLEQLGKLIGILTLGICIVVFGAGLIRGFPLMEIFIYAVGLAVAAIPEGLPAVVTISLALGVKRMVKRNALIRKLPSVETLGCTTVICSDKTGTLTHNQMTVKKIYVDGAAVDVEGSGYDPTGSFSKKTKGLELLLKIGVQNNDSKLEKRDNEYKIIGDPTEGALVVSAEKLGLNKEALDEKDKRIDEIPFDSARKLMSTLHKIGDKKMLYVKGAPDILLDSCISILENGKEKKLTPADKKKILAANAEFSKSALRVLGFAYKTLKKEDKKENWEKALTFVGLQGMIDPPRKEVKDAISRCKTAGIKVVMITGDFIGTAVAIADDLGITGKAITGAELRNIDLDKEVEEIGIYARVNPEDKMKIVEALKRKGHIVAMTGDGVNDAPALKRSDLGIAMGITGTDVAKEASSMILTDDNFASIVNAVEEGRTIYDNIKKFVIYLLSSNIGEVLVAFVSLLAGLPLPVVVTQLLWINLVTDGAPATALSVDPAEKGIMSMRPRKTSSNIVSKKTGILMFLLGLVMMAATLGVFLYALMSHGWTYGIPIYSSGAHKSSPELLATYAYASTMAFTTLVMLQMFNVFNARNMRKSIFKTGLFTNKWLLIAVFSSLLLQLVVIYSPINQFFNCVPLNIGDWAVIIAASTSIIVFGEIFKAVGIKDSE
ncbi:MAG: calcium-translocating P-type ATPase, PMCA-type [archaeon]